MTLSVKSLLANNGFDEILKAYGMKRNDDVEVADTLFGLAHLILGANQKPMLMTELLYRESFSGQSCLMNLHYQRVCSTSIKRLLWLLSFHCHSFP